MCKQHDRSNADLNKVGTFVLGTGDIHRITLGVADRVNHLSLCFVLLFKWLCQVFHLEHSQCLETVLGKYSWLKEAIDISRSFAKQIDISIRRFEPI